MAGKQTKRDVFNAWQSACLRIGEGRFLKDHEAWNSYRSWCESERKRALMFSQPAFAVLLSQQDGLEYRCRLCSEGHSGPAGWNGAEVQQ